MKKFYAYLATLTLAVSSILLFNFMNGESQAMPRDCDGNAIMKCGAANAGELKNKYSQNSTGDLDNIYKAYGLSDSDLKNAGSRAKMGAVHKDGRVTVGSETVATGAKTIGRHHMPGSSKKVIGGKTYWERSPSVSFGSSSISAFVYFDANGEFRAAIITSCGNPVIAVAKKKPAYACNSLTANKITRTEYSFTASASAKNGATIVSYNYDFGDGKKTTSASKTVKHTYAKPGTYTAKMTVNVKVSGKTKTVSGTKCQVKITVLPPPVTPSYTCDGLAATDISRTEYRFKASASAAGGATVTGYTFDFGDGTKKTTSEDTITHEYAEEGTYTVKVTANVKVNGETKTATGEKCQLPVTVGAAPAYACDSLEMSKISRTEYSFDGKATAENGAEIIGYTFDFGDGNQQTVENATGVKHTYEKEGEYTATMSVTVKVDGETKTAISPNCAAKVTVVPPNKVQVCNPETGEIITVDEKDQDKYVSVGDPACEPKAEECKPGIPVGDERCEPCPIPGKEHLPKDSSECVETPPVTELPKTGTGSLIGGMLGLGSMVTAAGYYVASRRGLLETLLNR